jgi:drug/metabolite transporter (DMT)-like permease
MSPSTLAGVLAGCAAALIGGGWQVMTREATTRAGLAPADLALLRYCIPALLLLPVLWPMLPRLRGLRWPPLAFMLAGGGLPFGLMAMGGTRFAPAAHMGVLVAGASPLMAAALAWLLWRERIAGWRLAGLVLVAAGVFALGARAFASGEGQALGDAMFLAAALLWAGFTLSFRRSGLDPWEATALVNAGSALLLLPWLASQGTGLGTVPWQQLATAALWQGVLAGVAGLALFSLAIARLGAAPAAAFGALAPVVSALAGWAWLGESLSVLEWLAVSCATAGVALASGVLDRSSDE